MIEKLAGRLKWERADQGIRVVIPARWGWLAISAAAAVVGATIEAMQLEWMIPSDEALFRLGVLGAVVVALGVCAAVAWISWSFTGKTVVTINQNEMRIQRRVLGIEWDTRRFATCDVRNLRYLPPTEIRAFRTDTDPNTSKIQFQAKNRTVRFASGITEREACALFDRMQEIYKFPKDTELDQVAIA
jgi:hypothetical protein